MTYVCDKCQQPRTADEMKYSIATTGTNCLGRKYIGSTCKKCDNERRKKHYEDNRDRTRWYGILRRYGLTPEQWNAIFDAQGSRCAVCLSTDPKTPKGWQVDHDHVTGVVRGILCIDCNRLLGAARDNAEVLASASRYLQVPRPDAPLVPVVEVSDGYVLKPGEQVVA